MTRMITTRVLLATVFCARADLAKAHAHFEYRPPSSSQAAVALLSLCGDMVTLGFIASCISWDRFKFDSISHP